MAGELCEECPAAKALFDQASEILGYDLLDVCVNGPAEKLNSTEVSQPAIYVSSLAALEKMKSTEEGQALIDSVDVCAGLSLGEYTALTFAGAIAFEDGVKLVKLRGESMQAAADAVPSGMASVIGKFILINHRMGNQSDVIFYSQDSPRIRWMNCAPKPPPTAAASPCRSQTTCATATTPSRDPFPRSIRLPRSPSPSSRRGWW